MINNSTTLPLEVKSLIECKLRHLKHEWEGQWLISRQAAYSKLREDMLASIASRRLGAVFSSVPREAYKALVASTIAATREWPSTVWRAVRSILDQLPTLPADPAILNSFVDEFA